MTFKDRFDDSSSPSNPTSRPSSSSANTFPTENDSVHRIESKAKKVPALPAGNIDQLELTPDGDIIPDDVWLEPAAAVAAPKGTGLAWIDDPENSMIMAQAGCRHEPNLMCARCQAKRMQFCTASPSPLDQPACDPDEDIHVPGCWHDRESASDD